eukprot:10958510-Alexandrium_andersonii.AAC.1
MPGYSRSRPRLCAKAVLGFGGSGGSRLWRSAHAKRSGDSAMWRTWPRTRAPGRRSPRGGPG